MSFSDTGQGTAAPAVLRRRAAQSPKGTWLRLVHGEFFQPANGHRRSFWTFPQWAALCHAYPGPELVNGLQSLLHWVDSETSLVAHPSLLDRTFAYSFLPGIPSAHCACIRGSVPPRFLQFASASFVAASGLDRGPAQPTMRIFCPCECAIAKYPGLLVETTIFGLIPPSALTPSKASLSTSPLETLLPW